MLKEDMVKKFKSFLESYRRLLLLAVEEESHPGRADELIHQLKENIYLIRALRERIELIEMFDQSHQVREGAYNPIDNYSHLLVDEYDGLLVNRNGDIVRECDIWQHHEDSRENPDIPDLEPIDNLFAPSGELKRLEE